MIREMMEPVKISPVEKKAPRSARSIEELTRVWGNLNEKAQKIITNSTDTEFNTLINKLVKSGKISLTSAEEFRMLRIFYLEQKDKVDHPSTTVQTQNGTTIEAIESKEEKGKPSIFKEKKEDGTTYYYCVLTDQSILDRADILKKDPYEAWLNAAETNLGGKKVRYPTKDEAEKLLRSMQNKEIPQTLACFINEKNTYFYLSPDGKIRTKEGPIPSWAIEPILVVVPE